MDMFLPDTLYFEGTVWNAPSLDLGDLSDAQLLTRALRADCGCPMAAHLAGTLLRTFGSFSNVVHADTSRLMTIDGVTPSVIKALGAVRLQALRLAKAEIESRPLIGSWSALSDYLRVAIGHDDVEQFHILYLNQAHRLIRDETLWRGAPNHTPVYPSQVVRRALALAASAVIVAHNHPADDCTPSPADCAVTRSLVQALATVNIGLHDHIIVAKTGQFSFRSAGLLS